MLQEIKNKKGVSVMIGYVLLISIAVIMGGVMYVWMKSYVPSGDDLKCQEGTSLIIKDYSYSCSTKELNLTLFNNGRFNLGGYYIYASNNSNQTLATINVYNYFTQINGFQNYGSVIFNRNNNNTFIYVGGGSGASPVHITHLHTYSTLGRREAPQNHRDAWSPTR